MNRFSYALVKCAAETFGKRGPVWEIGSYRVEGQEEYGDCRDCFGGLPYVGCDMREGPRVDRIEDVTALSAADGSIGALLCLNTLEHVFEIRRGFDEIARVVADDGMAIIDAPFYFKVHDYPGDFWRVAPEAMRRLTEGFPWRVIGWLGWETTPSSVFCVGMKREPEDFAAKFERFKTRLSFEGVEPRGVLKRAKEFFGYHLVSKRAFRPLVFSQRMTFEMIEP
jgi:hypothetical protein